MIQVYDLDYYILNGRVIDFGEEYLEYIRKPIELAKFIKLRFK